MHRSMAGDGHNPFHVLCKMYGVDMAKKLAKNLGLKVTKEEIERERVMEEEKTKAMLFALTGIKEGDNRNASSDMDHCGV